jgi:subtilase family serine protease
MKRLFVIGAVTCGALVLAGLAAALTGSGQARAMYPTPHPTISDYQFISRATPSQSDCAAVGRTCFGPQAIQSAYNLGPLYAQGLNGAGMTIAIVDSSAATPWPTTCTCSIRRSDFSRCVARRT